MRPQPALDRHRSINALAETINGLYKAEVIHRRGPWRSFEAVEFATLEWVDSTIAGCWSRSATSRSSTAGATSHGSVSQTKQPPANPGGSPVRFSGSV